MWDIDDGPLAFSNLFVNQMSSGLCSDGISATSQRKWNYGHCNIDEGTRHEPLSPELAVHGSARRFGLVTCISRFENTIEESESDPFAPRGIDLKFHDKRKAPDEGTALKKLNQYVEMQITEALIDGLLTI
ncbi:hypothetical protein V6N13_107417 [Hibiscus sabdariffa]